jgi:hypothetical protein
MAQWAKIRQIWSPWLETLKLVQGDQNFFFESNQIGPKFSQYCALPEEFYSAVNDLFFRKVLRFVLFYIDTFG